MDKLQAIFKTEAEELLLALERALLKFESDLTDMESVREIFRVMHTLKGSAGTVGARRLASAAAALEIGLRGSVDGSVHLDELQAALEEFRRSADRLPIKRNSAPVEVVSTTAVPIPADVEPLVRSLIAQLEQNDFAAAETFAELRRQLRGARGEEMQIIEEALDRLDFDAARQHVDAIRDALQARGNA